MKIDEQRRLVVPLVTDYETKIVDGKEVREEIVRTWAYHTPISKEVFEANFRVLAATKSALASKGVHYLMSSGPRISVLTLKDEGKKDMLARGVADDNEVVALLREISRLTLVLCPGSSGWDMLPVETAIQQKKLDVEDWEEALSGIVFFTVHFAMAKKSDRETVAKAMSSLLGSQITSLVPMEFAASLPTLTPVEFTAQVHSSIPS